MPDLYDYVLRAWVLVRELGNANMSWFPPKLGVFVERFFPLDLTKLCPNGVASTECFRLLNHANKNISDVIKLVYNRWVVKDYAICMVAIVWSLMNNNLNNQVPMLIATFLFGHVVQTGVHAFVVQTVTRCRDDDMVCGWFEHELMPLHGMVSFAFLLVYVFCLRSNTTAQRTIVNVERLNGKHVKINDDVKKIQEELAETKEELAQTRDELAKAMVDLEILKIRQKITNFEQQQQPVRNRSRRLIAQGV